jgi:hypothetical protein
MTKLSPLEPEFETTEEAQAYEAWLKAKVAAVIARDGPKLPHDMAMAETRALIEDRKRRDAEARLGS